MLEKIRRNLTESLCDRNSLIDWLNQIIDNNNRVDFKPQEANPGTWYERAIISRTERSKRGGSCWENPNYQLNQFLRQLIIAVGEQRSLDEIEAIFTTIKNKSLEVEFELKLIEQSFLKRLDCVLWQENLQANKQQPKIFELFRARLSLIL